MIIKKVESHSELLKNIEKKDNSYLLLYKSGSEKSECAFENLKKVVKIIDNINVFSADVSKVRDIHTKYSITSAPALLEFKGNKFKNIIKGCQNEKYYKSLFENIIYIAKAKKEGKTLKNVVVYSTQTCSWCNTLKSYLKKNNIKFKDVDVSKDQKAAEAMVKKSGQQGVPQTEINGQIIVGFDKTKINTLLEIK